MNRGAGPAHWGTRLLLFCAALLAAACGYVGEPLPPLANIPARITDLAAVQRGGRLIIHFTPPTHTTEGTAIKTPLNLDLRIGTAVAPFSADAWAEQAKQIPPAPVNHGLAEYEVPVAGWEGKDVTIAARSEGANRKDSGWSNFVNLAVVAPPAAPSGIKPEATPEGVRLTWQGGPAEYRVFRRTGDEKSFGPPSAASAPEWVDHETEFGKTYTYVIQRIVHTGRTVAESDLSAPVTITPKDIFPPAAPTGLRALAAPNSVELTWERNAEPDLAAYRIYRAVGDAAFEKLDEVRLPAYSDHKVEAGKTYRYQITAVDEAANESKASVAIAVIAQ